MPALRLVTDQIEQAGKAVKLLQAVPGAEADTLYRLVPVVVAADPLQSSHWKFDNEFLAIIRVGQVSRIIRIYKQ
ncbi:hypothetical protein D3C78_1924220 [compost metagenome]